jgi:hypothetical protein
MLELPLEKRIDAFQILGAKLTAWLLAYHENRNAGKTDSNDPLLRLVREQVSNNPWFVEEQIIRALKEWAFLLNTKDLTEWTSALNERTDSKRIALIPAGNIPLVGFHDVLSVLISGHSLLLRPSSDDPALIPLLLLMLEEIEPAFKERIRIADGRLQNFDAVIATGSNNSARYFNHYFGKYPHIIRKNRTSVALLNGSETEEDLKGLADDVMAYFGLGCRSVTKVFMPQDFDLDRIFGQLYHYRHYLNCKPFADNYDYHRSLWMMNSIPFLENGFMLVREEASIHSPVSALHYERYENLDQVKQELLDREEELQMVVGKDVDFFPRTSGLGRGQMPALDDYADGVDTLKFLNDL